MMNVGGLQVRQTIGLATEESSQFGRSPEDGLFGLGFNTIESVRGVKTFMDNVIAAGLLVQPVVSVFLPSQRFFNGNGGEYLFGGIDTSKFTGSLKYVPVTERDTGKSPSVTRSSMGTHSTKHLKVSSIPAPPSSSSAMPLLRLFTITSPMPLLSLATGGSSLVQFATTLPSESRSTWEGLISMSPWLILPTRMLVMVCATRVSKAVKRISGSSETCSSRTTTVSFPRPRPPVSASPPSSTRFISIAVVFFCSSYPFSHAS